MFKQISEELVHWLGALPQFTAIMKREINGVNTLMLFPIVARVENTLPLTTYVLSERLQETKDKAQITITLRFWFGVEKYDDCCEFTDKMTDFVDELYMLDSSSIEYNEEFETFFGEVNFNLI